MKKLILATMATMVVAGPTLAAQVNRAKHIPGVFEPVTAAVKNKWGKKAGKATGDAIFAGITIATGGMP